MEGIDGNAGTGGLDSIERIVEKVAESSGRKPEDIKKLIEEKQDELSGLVSEEGAAYIVARELGVSLLKATKRQLKVKNLMPGLRSVDMVARVVKVFEPHEWARGDRSGKVASMILGDETGTVRLSLWNEEIEKVFESGISEGDGIRVSGAFVKMDGRGQADLRLGKGSIERVEDSQSMLPAAGNISTAAKAQRRQIKDFKEGDYGEMRACLVQIFKRTRPFYEVCPQCGTRLAEDNGRYECREHGAVEPDYHMIASGVVDDGTANMRIVFFRDMAEKMLGKTVKQMRDDLSRGKSQEEMYEKSESIGKEFIFQGRVKRNDLSGNLEFVANSIDDVDVKAEARRLAEELKGG